MEVPVALNRKIPAILTVMLVGAFAACDEETEYVTVVLQRPVDFAVTCVASDYSFLDLEKCAEDTSTSVAWVLDDDMGGVFVGNVRTGKLIDTDVYMPGYTPIPVGERLTRIIASPDSRDVYVATGRGAGATPELVRIPADFYNIVGVSGRYPVACPIVDMVMIRDETIAAGWYIAAVLDCPEGDQLWKYMPVAAADQVDANGFVQGRKLADIPGIARWIGAGTGRAVVVSRDLPVAGGYAGWDHILVFDGIAADSGVFTAVPVVNDSALATLHQNVNGAGADCATDDARVLGGYVSGRPAVSPDGRFIYVPISVPSGVAVFDAALARVDTHAFITGDTVDSTVESESWQFANRFFQYLGYKDIRMDSPAAGVAFVEIPDVGVRAVAWLYGGQIVRIVVDPTDELPWPHRSENDLEGIESSAYQPVVWYMGDELENGIKTRGDLPSFGSKAVVLPATDDEHYVYYGIQFNGDIEAEAPETWAATYEGVIPGASGQCGDLVSGDSEGWLTQYVMTAGNTDFCALGVEGARDGYEGDVVDVVLPSIGDCGALAGKTVSFRVSDVWGTALSLRPIDATAAVNPIGWPCSGQDLAWSVRASDQWVVAGSRSGFLHPWMTSGGVCVHRPDFDPIFTGRAPTAMPESGDLVVDSCPIARGLDSMIDWDDSWFRNPIFGFWIIPGCKLDADYQPVVIPPVRDTVLKFAMETGRIPNQNDIGGLSSALLVHGGTLFSLDSSNGRLVMLNPAEMEITYSWF